MFDLLSVRFERLFEEVQRFEIAAVDQISSTGYEHVPEYNRCRPSTAHAAHFRHSQFAEDEYVVER